VTLAATGSLSGKPTTVGTAAFSVKVTDSASHTATASLTIAIAAQGPLSSYEFTGDTFPVHDPSILRQGSTYYVFVTDAGGQSGFIPIRCSTDRIAWTSCGYVFSMLPSWIASAVPLATGIWAPDISYFNGLYHLYYAVSSFGSQVSAIGMATNTTLDATDPKYRWVDHGSAVLQSAAGGNFNAIDPSLLVDTDGSVWMTYGSFWSGIFEQQIDPATGLIKTGSVINHLAERAASVPNDPIEGSSLVHKGNYYYLFVSWDYCCESVPAQSDYKIVVGRGTSPQGPFVDQTGADMLAGGGTILLQGDGVTWAGPGGQTAYIDPNDGDLIVYHALNLTQNGLDYLFVRSLSWVNDWPVIGTTSVTMPSLTQTTTALSASATTVTVGTPVTLTATVAASGGATPIGTVNFNSGSTLLGTGTLDGTGKATLTLSSLAAGTYSITASYVGSGTDGASASAVVQVTVQAQSAVLTTTVATASFTSRLQGLPLTIYATVTPASGTAIPTGAVVFTDGTNALGSGVLDVSGRATVNTTKLAVGSHAITASYGGDTNYDGSISATLPLTITKTAGTTYTNPLPMTDPSLGAVTSCPDPAVIKSQAGSVDTWYMYCTGDAHNSTDLLAGALNNHHLISIYKSSDLVNWTYERDAFTALPSWAGAGALAWAPAIKYFNSQYYLYYTVTTSTYMGGTSAIGVGTSATPDGPFTDSGTAVVQPELVPATMDGGGGYRWLFDADEIQDSGGQRYLLFGSFLGGISVRKLSADGLTTDASSEQLIADDQRYEGGAWFEHDGYYYLLASATNCCAGPLTGYGVFAGRAKTPLGPYLDQSGVSLTAANVGGTQVLAMNGNPLAGPGGGNAFTDEAGQDYYVYHTVTLEAPYYAGFNGATERPAALDAIDWVNGWPVARGGFGPSDSVAPQPVPVAQPGGATGYALTLDANDAPNVAIAGLSDEFNGATIGAQWGEVHSQPAYTLSGGALQMPTVGFDTTNAMGSVPLLAESAPAGDYMVETKVSLNLPLTGNSVDYAQAGLLLYKDDSNYLRMDLYANSDTRQVEFIKGETPEGANYPTWSATDLGPAGVVSGNLTSWMRIVKRTVDGVDRYTA
jgi:arabinan endo-1,5-alpha-L-arabinosidase